MLWGLHPHLLSFLDADLQYRLLVHFNPIPGLLVYVGSRFDSGKYRMDSESYHVLDSR